MIKIKGLDHIVLRTAQIDSMQRFYLDVLGCTLERELGEAAGLRQLRAGLAIIDLINVDSELGRVGGREADSEGRNLDHFCLQIEPVSESELIDYLQSHGISAGEFAERYGAEGFGRSIYIQDPDGNTIELKPKIK